MCPDQQISNLLESVSEPSRELCFLCCLIAFFIFPLDSDENRCSWHSCEARPALAGVYIAYGIRKWFSIGFQWFMCIYLLFRELCQILVTLVEMWILTALGFAFSQDSCYAMSENIYLLPSGLCITVTSLFLCHIIGKMAVMGASFFSWFRSATVVKCGQLCIAAVKQLCATTILVKCVKIFLSILVRPWLNTRSGVWLGTLEFHVLEVFLLVISGLYRVFDIIYILPLRNLSGWGWWLSVQEYKNT